MELSQLTIADLVSLRLWVKATSTCVCRDHRQGGGQAVVTPEKLEKAMAHIAAGLNVREAAARVKVSKTALYKAFKQA